MGAWGVKIDQNDTALDFRGDFQELMRKGEHTPYEAISELLEDNGDIEEILMAGQIEMDIFGYVKHFEEVMGAIEIALSDEELDAWQDPSERKEELIRFKEHIIAMENHHSDNKRPINAKTLKDMLIQYSDEELEDMELVVLYDKQIESVEIEGGMLFFNLV